MRNFSRGVLAFALLAIALCISWSSGSAGTVWQMFPWTRTGTTISPVVPSDNVSVVAKIKAGAQAEFDMGPGPDQKYPTVMVVNQDYSTDPYEWEGQANSIFGVVSSTTPDSTLFGIDGADFFAQWKGTSSPNTLSLVGTSGYGLVGDYFDSTVAANAANVSKVIGGYFLAGIKHSTNNDLPLARGILLSVDNLNRFNGGATGKITTGQLAYFHAGTHTFGDGSAAVTNLYGIYMDDMTGATNNWAIRTQSGKVQFGEAPQSDALTGSGNAFACLDSDGKLYRSATPCVP